MFTPLQAWSNRKTLTWWNVRRTIYDDIFEKEIEVPAWVPPQIELYMKKLCDGTLKDRHDAVQEKEEEEVFVRNPLFKIQNQWIPQREADDDAPTIESPEKDEWKSVLAKEKGGWRWNYILDHQLGENDVE